MTQPSELEVRIDAADLEEVKSVLAANAELLEELKRALAAAADLADAVRELLDFIPGDVSPVVLPRTKLDPLAERLSDLEAAAGTLPIPTEGE